MEEKDIVGSIKAQEDKITEFLAKDGYSQIIESGKFLAIPHRGNNGEFFDEYVLNSQDFPLPDSKFYQSITEMQARVQSLVSRIYDYKNIVLEIEDLGLQIEEIEAVDATGIAKKRNDVKIRQLKNEITNKEFALGFVKSDIQETYNEFIAWKSLVEKYDEQKRLPDFGVARQAEMEVKKGVIRFKYTDPQTGKVRPDLAQGGEVPFVIAFDSLNQAIINSSGDKNLKKFQKQIDTLPVKKILKEL
jgi:hypothetical protein